MAPRSEAERISQLTFYGSVLLIVWLAWRIVQPFLVEICWAVVLAICLEPVRVRLLARLGPTRTALALTALVLVLLVIPVFFVGTTLVREGNQAVSYMEGQLRDRGGPTGFFHTAWDWLRARASFLPSEEDLIADLTARLGSAAQFAAGQAGGILKGLANFTFSLLLMLGVLFFLLRDAGSFAAALRGALPFGAEQNERLVALTSELVSASVTATLAIAAIQGLIGALAFALLGIKGAVLWGVMMALLALVPLVGATLVWLPAAVWLAVSGSLAKGVTLALVGVLVLGSVDNVVRPLLLSGKSQMNTLVLIISLMGGVSAFGFIGIVLGPLVAAVFTAVVYSVAPEAAPEPTPAPPAAAQPAAGDLTPKP